MFVRVHSSLMEHTPFQTGLRGCAVTRVEGFAVTRMVRLRPS